MGSLYSAALLRSTLLGCETPRPRLFVFVLAKRTGSVWQCGGTSLLIHQVFNSWRTQGFSGMINGIRRPRWMWNWGRR